MRHLPSSVKLGKLPPRNTTALEWIIAYLMLFGNLLFSILCSILWISPWIFFPMNNSKKRTRVHFCDTNKNITSIKCNFRASRKTVSFLLPEKEFSIFHIYFLLCAMTHIQVYKHSWIMYSFFIYNRQKNKNLFLLFTHKRTTDCYK